MTEEQQAFPVPGLSGLANNEFIYPMTGMSLRDYFAAKAMQGLVNDIKGEPWARITAANAYKVADTMLEARKA